ncbi:MAG: type II secretion system F family protein [DPANN group archaeon]|nr:type II secretion system F family protein [DPANN group archaeon]
MANNEIKSKTKINTSSILKYGSIFLGFVIIFVGATFLMSGASKQVGMVLFMVGALVSIVPSSILSYLHFSKYRNMELEFPRFLRDLGEAKKSGMTFPQAFVSRRDTKYGQLSEEIRKASNQLSWGIPFSKVLTMIVERLKESALLRRTFTIIIEAFNAGGDVSEVLDDLSNDVQTLKEIDAERTSALSQQVIMMYFISFLFLGIILMLFNLLIPMLSADGLGSISGAEGGALVYCEYAEFLCSLCDGFNWEGTVAAKQASYNDRVTARQLCYFKSLFFMMALIQAIGSGLISGEMSEGSVKAGVKHCLILGIVTVSIFMIA